MLQDSLLSGALVRKPTSDLLLHLLANPILRDTSFPASLLPSFPSKEPLWTSQSSSMMETQSFTARRSAANNLPQFSLPPPDHLSHMPKYPAYAPSSSTQPTPAIVSSVLTPPAGLASDLSPLASSVNSGSSGSSGSSAQGVPPYQPMGYWPTPNQPSYGFSSAPSMPAPFAPSQQQPYNMGRQLYSPSMSFPNRNNHPSSNEGLPPPPYDIPPPPFPTPMSGGGQPQNQSLPTLAPHHQQQQNQQHPGAQQQQQQGQHQQQINSHGHPAASQPPQQSPLHAPDTYGRPPPTPNSYYTPASTPQQSSFPAYTQQSPTQHSPNTTSAPRISPVAAQSHSSMAAPQGYHGRPPYGGYNLPAMAGPIMSNVHNPGNQMALVGGMNMQGYPQHPHMYGHHPQGPAPPNDRPFKCDQCPQSFNRNHDLKRHKRIHLAVKPFPCGHCEKSFSRKDALKRHILVKGCGKGPSNGATGANGGSQSPVDKSEIMSDSAEDNSPEMTKKELA